MRLLDGQQLLSNTLGATGRAIFPLGRMHQILQEVLLRRLGTEVFETRNQAIASVVDAVAVSLQSSNLPPDVLPIVDALQAYVWPRLNGEQISVGRVAVSLAELLLRRGDIGSATKCAIAAVRLSESQAASAPENADYARDLSVSYERMGDLFRALGDGVEARKFYEQALEVRQRLSASAPENADYASDLSVSYNKMGDLFRALGDGVEARKFYEQALEDQLSGCRPARRRMPTTPAISPSPTTRWATCSARWVTV